MQGEPATSHCLHQIRGTLRSLHAFKCFLTYHSKDVAPEEVAHSQSPDALRVRQMNRRIDEVTKQHRDAKFRRQRAYFSERARIGLEETDLK